LVTPKKPVPLASLSESTFVNPVIVASLINVTGSPPTRLTVNAYIPVFFTFPPLMMRFPVFVLLPENTSVDAPVFITSAVPLIVLEKVAVVFASSLLIVSAGESFSARLIEPAPLSKPVVNVPPGDRDFAARGDGHRPGH
jgi:hypothetical protein